MKIFDEFKSFAMRGNVIDLAVWVVIGAAFWKIVSSLVADIITPTVWVIVWWVNFTKLWYTITDLKGQEVTIAYGNFLQTLFDFIIIAFAIFMVVKVINKAQEKMIKKQKADEKKEIVKKADDVVLLEEIRDLLKGDKWVKIPHPTTLPNVEETIKVDQKAVGTSKKTPIVVQKPKISTTKTKIPVKSKK